MFELLGFFCLLIGAYGLNCDSLVCNCNGDICSSCLYSFHYLEVNSCEPCPYVCKSCSSASVCSDCISSFYLQGSTCKLCPQNCESCSSGLTCTRCLTGYYLSQSQCLKCSSAYVASCDSSDMVVSCQSGYWQNGNSCSPCRQFCLICSSPSNCLQCQQGYYVAIGFGSYCAKCTTGCQTCSSAGCSQCSLNYLLRNGACLSILPNCSAILHCQKCTQISTISCYSCLFPYYLSNGVCLKGSSLLCPYGASGGMYYQCLNGCGSNGYSGVSSNVCLPMQWTASFRQVYYNAYDPSFTGKLYQTATQKIYFDPQGQTAESNTLLLTFTFEPYYKLVLNLKLIADVAPSTTISLTFSLADNSSNTQSSTVTVVTDTVPCPIYTNLTSKTIKDQSVTLTVLSSSSTAPVVGLSELIVQIYPCPTSCRLCYNAELCIQCQSQYFNTPEYLCVKQCIGYLQLYMPSGNISSYSYKQCVLTCPDGFFSVEVNSTYRCEKCMGLCLNCLSSTQCLTCQSPYIYYDIDFQCLLACPSTHYELNYVCKLCLAPCMTCLDASTCLSCSIGYYYNGTCLASCPQGTYANTTAGSCDVCASQCLSCEGSPSFCLTCVSPYLLFESSCLLGCPSALYYQLESLCLSCSSPCLTCSSSSSCLSCQLGYLFSTSCLSSCQDGYYSDTLTSACRPCSSSCLTCESQTICLSCLSPLNLYSYSCISQCPSGTYAHNSICVNCLQPCSSCTNSSYCLNCSIGYLSALTLGTCLSSCQNGYFSSAATASCLKCVSNCLTCSSSESSCTSCTPGLLLEGTRCVLACSAGGYNLSGICFDCSFPCYQCTGNDYTCLSCKQGYILLNAACLTQCPSFTFLNQSECAGCVPPCLTCTSSTQCLSCVGSSDPSTQTFLSGGQCLLSCPFGYFRDLSGLTCRQCSYPCLTCSSQTSCLSCLSGYLNPTTASCEYCSGQYFGNDSSKQCQLCSSVLSNCLECLSSTECTVCINATVLFNSICLSTASCQAEIGYFVDLAQMLCSVCLSPCQTCLNASFCLTCSSGMVLAGACLSLCPDGWFELSGQCLVCNSTCRTCLNASACLSCNTSGLTPVYYQQYYQCIDSSLCKEGCYIDASYGWPVCSNCPSPCLTCLNSSYCLTCLTGLFFEGGCKSICPSGYYSEQSNPTDPRCLPCSPACFKCSMISTNCTSCDVNLYLKNYSCVSDCGDGYYLDSYVYECFQCVQPCYNCSSVSVCLSCLNSSYLLYENQCLLTCPSSTYMDSTSRTCAACPGSCLTCSYSSSTSSVQCIQCVHGLYMSANTPGLCLSSCGSLAYGDATTLKCYSCVAPCLECTSAIKCKSCVASYLLVETQCLAIDRCPAGRYLSSRECLLSCGQQLWANQQSATCEGSCSQPLLKVIANSSYYCVGQCWTNYRVDLNYTCSQCVSTVCDNLLRVEVQVKSIFNSLYLKISFSQQVHLADITTGDLTITAAPISARLLAQGGSVSEGEVGGGRLLASGLAYSVSVFNLDAIWLKINTSESLSSCLLTVVFRDYYLVGADTPLQQLSITSPLTSFDVYSEETQSQGKRFQYFSQTMSLIMLIIFLVNVALNAGHLSYLIVDCYQLFFMLLFLSVDYPPPLNHFLYGFRYSHYLFLPQVFRGTPEQEYSSSTPDKFGVVVPDVYFLNNAGPSFIIIGITLAVLAGSKALQECLKRAEMCRSNRVGVQEEEGEKRSAQGGEEEKKEYMSEQKESKKKNMKEKKLKGKGPEEKMKGKGPEEKDKMKGKGREQEQEKKKQQEIEKDKEQEMEKEKEKESQLVGQGRCVRFFQAVVTRFKWNYFNDVIYTIYFSLMLFAFSQLYDLTWRPGTPSDIVSTLLAFVFILAGVLVPPGLAYFLHHEKDRLIYSTISRDRQQFEKRIKITQKMENQGQIIAGNESQGGEKEEVNRGEDYQILTDFKCFVAGVRLRVRLGFYHVPLAYFRKLVMACLIIYCSQYPSLVLGMAMMFSLIDILIVLVLRPYRLTFEQIVFPIFSLLSLLIFLTICLMQLPLINLPQTQKLTASITAIVFCVLLSVLVAIHNIVMNLAEIVKQCWKIDWFRGYYQSDFLQGNTVEEEQSEQVTNVPLKREEKGEEDVKVEEDVKAEEGESQPQSMLSGLDIYLRREKDVPKYLIKCVKPEGETELKVADIKVSELSHRESSSSKSSEGSSPSGRPPSENIFANIRTIQLQNSESND